MLNIRCLHANKAELEYHLEMKKPQMVLIQEIWLNASHEEVKIRNYRYVSRRDRKKEENRGGILLLVREDFNQFVHIED